VKYNSAIIRLYFWSCRLSQSMIGYLLWLYFFTKLDLMDCHTVLKYFSHPYNESDDD